MCENILLDVADIVKKNCLFKMFSFPISPYTSDGNQNIRVQGQHQVGMWDYVIRGQNPSKKKRS